MPMETRSKKLQSNSPMEPDECKQVPFLLNRIDDKGSIIDSDIVPKSKVSTSSRVALRLAQLKEKQMKEELELETKLRLTRIHHEVELAKAQVEAEENDKANDFDDISVSATDTEPIMKRFLDDCSQLAIRNTNRKEKSPEPSRFDLPKVELAHFDGNISKYWSFIRQFEYFVENRTKDDGQRLLYLIHYCKGSAKEAIEDCIMLPARRGYEKAREILKDAYGQPHMIARNVIDNMLKSTGMNISDPESLMSLSRKMTGCEITLSQMNYSADLDAINTIEQIVSKLSVELRKKWSFRADELGQSGQLPTFKELNKFISEHARVYSSRFGQLARESDHQVRPAHFRNNQKVAEPMARNTNNFLLNGNTQVGSKDVRCWHCGDKHQIMECNKFLDSEIPHRWNIVRKNKKCFVCLKGGHLASKCYSQNACERGDCKLRHHTLLHSENIDSSSKLICATVNTCDNHVQLGVVAVRMEGPLGVVNTYAFLDNGSDSTLIRRDTMERLGLESHQTALKIRTVNGQSVIDSAVCKVDISSLDGTGSIQIGKAYCVESLPVSSVACRGKIVAQNWSHLKDIPISELDRGEITILIGCNSPEAHWVFDQRIGERGCPYAVKTLLGWVVFGPSSRTDSAARILRTSCETQLWEELKILYNNEFADISDGVDKWSFNDKKAVKIVNDGIKWSNNHFEIPLPWKLDDLNFPNNYATAVKRTNQLRNRLKKDETLHSEYVRIMNLHLLKGFVKKVEGDQLKPDYKPCWYLPHHPVMHPKKPGKVRVVFDCASKHEDKSLNDYLYQGPDTTNNLVGVLMRFRRESIALVADIEEMFLQVKVPVRDQSALRFLWWPEGNLEKPFEEYQLTVHPFGATSSPFCANFALQRTIEEFGSDCGDSVRNIMNSSFYVDDCLISLDDIKTAKEFTTQATTILRCGGFRLRKWMSNSREVLESIPMSERGITTMDVNSERLPTERTLGVVWDSESDAFRFKFTFTEKPMTRRNLLSCMSSIFDPLGFICPLLMPVKCLLQNLCRKQLSWDEVISDADQRIWKTWIQTMINIDELYIPRCTKPVAEQIVGQPQLHIFSDASETGYGVAAYIRYITMHQIYCNLIFAKARVAPLKTVTIPRLELNAAVLAARAYEKIKRELKVEFEMQLLWTDSTIVLHYVRNTTSRFQTFVANRLQTIHDLTVVSQWRHVISSENPADLTSRGQLREIGELKSWLRGPNFLLRSPEHWPEQAFEHEVSEAELEIKGITISHTRSTPECPMNRLLSYFSDWFKLLRAASWLNRFKTYLKVMQGRNTSTLRVGHLTVNEIREARSSIVKFIQAESYPIESSELLKTVVGHNVRVSKGPLQKLSPINLNGILCVGGRLHSSTYSEQYKHPVIMPRHHHVTHLIIDYYHKIEGHSGVNQVLSSIRQMYWIPQSRNTIKRVLNGCTACRRMKAVPAQQMMSNLPTIRIERGWSPFKYVGLDYFGPFLVRKNRSMEKRYGCIFTCLQCRAVHLEVAHGLDTDSFLLTLMRFVNRRGKPRTIYSDNGSNFVGAVNELRKCAKNWNQDRINNALLNHEIQWVFHPPSASHRGGVWERLIRSTRRILNSIICGQTLTDETLLTFFTEAERILNNRPIVPVQSDDDEIEVLRPNSLIMISDSRGITKGDPMEKIYIRKWKQANHMSEVFWNRWVKEYIPTLQTRQKWLRKTRNFRKNDVVLITSDTCPREIWPLGIVIESIADDDGLVRTVKLRTRDGVMTRDVRRVCLLEGVDESGGWPD